MKEESRWPNTDPIEWGKWNKGQGHRSDLDSIAESIKKSGLSDTIETFPAGFIKFHGGMQKLHNHYRRRNRRVVKVVKIASSDDIPEDCYIMQQGTTLKERFAGYEGEASIFYRPPREGIDGDIFCGLPLWIGDKWAEWTLVYRY